MSHMKYILISMFCITLTACGTVGDYYVAEENGEENIHVTLHKDENIFVHLDHFDGNISTLKIYRQSSEGVLDFRIVNVAQSLSADNAQIVSSPRDDTKSVLSANPESSLLFQITEVYELEIPIEQATEKVTIELIVNEKPINIAKEFRLRRVTYSHLQALMGI